MKDEKKRSLKELLAKWAETVDGTELPQPPAYDGPDVMLTRLVEHTDHTRPGTAFVARVRETSDGHRYVGQAVEKGASLIVGQRSPADLDVDLPADVPYLQVDDTAVAYAWLAAAWEGFPGRELVTVGVTGTDGKTTTANFLHAILGAAGIKAGLLSTLKAVVGDEEEPLALHVTTPEAPVVQRYLRRMVDAGLTHCVLEATSHGLAQHRVDAVDFDVAVVTNITHEHLDYHGDYASYFAAKARLFEGLERGDWRLEGGNPEKGALEKTAILNKDDGSYNRLVAIPAGQRLTYAITEKADVYATDIAYDADATRFALHLPYTAVAVAMNLLGDFNVYNALAAATAAHSLGVAPLAMKEGLEAVAALPGRMQRVDEGQPFLVVVDFAHTPNGLEQAIAAAREMAQGRIITVFGSAGKRDVQKRRLMAQISGRDAGLTVLTAEDPRTESLDDILETMAAGCRRFGGIEGETFWRVRDRGRAIYHALALARPGDLVLICGKGHEQSICFGTTEYPWDDVQATRTALKAYQNDAPMPDLGLPTFRAA